MEKQYTIQNRVIALDDVHALALYLERERGKWESSAECKLSFIATCADGTKLPGADASLFSHESGLSCLHVTSVSMRLDCGDSCDSVQVQLTHGSAPKGSYIVVNGDDPVWVEGILEKLITIVHSFASRNLFAGRLYWPTMVLAAMGFGACVAGLILLFYAVTHLHIPRWALPLNAPMLEWPLGVLIVVYGLKLIVGWWPAHALMSWLRRCLPLVEMQVGPPHVSTGRTLRTWALLLLPSIISLLGSIIGDLHGTNFR